MATKSDIQLAKFSMASNVGIAFMAIGVAYLGIAVSLPSVNAIGLKWGAIAVGIVGAIICVASYWLIGRIKADSK